jgi:hypothetical protein
MHGTAELMFHSWHRVRDGTMTRREFREWMIPVRERVEWLLERCVGLDVRGLSGRRACHQKLLPVPRAPTTSMLSGSRADVWLWHIDESR